MLKQFLCAVLVASVLQASVSDARELVIAFSPFQSAQSAKAQAKTTLKFLTSLEPGDRAVLMDGYALNSLGRFVVPEGKAYASVKARLGANKKAVGALMRFAKSAQAPTGDNAPSVTGAMRLPQLLGSVAENLSPSAPLDVIVLGSPLYDDPKEAGFSMAGGLFPSDSHLSRSRADTPFGASDNPDLLSNIRLHLGFESEAIFPTDQHRFFIRRFWTLYAEAQSGSLVSFTGDTQTLFERVTRGSKQPTNRYTLEQTDKLEMIRLRRKEVEQPIYDRPVTREALSLREAVNADQVEIGITWDVNCSSCDLDLYAGLPGKDVLYFGNPETPEGEHFKDYRQSPKNMNGFETIAFSVPVDLSELKLGVSFYSGSTSTGVHGEIRVTIGGETFAQPFHIPATRGNVDNGAVAAAFNSGEPSASHVIVIDPMSIVGLRP